MIRRRGQAGNIRKDARHFLTDFIIDRGCNQPRIHPPVPSRKRGKEVSAIRTIRIQYPRHDVARRRAVGVAQDVLHIARREIAGAVDACGDPRRTGAGMTVRQQVIGVIFGHQPVVGSDNITTFGINFTRHPVKRDHAAPFVTIAPSWHGKPAVSGVAVWNDSAHQISDMPASICSHETMINHAPPTPSVIKRLQIRRAQHRQ